MRRRAFIGLVGGAAVWPLGVRGQGTLVVGFLDPTSLRDRAPLVSAFRAGLIEAGYREGDNVRIEYRWAEGQNSRLPALVNDLVRQKVTVIVASGGIPAVQAAKAATTTIPIVFLTAADPVQFGLVATLNRPGGNVTGVTTLGAELGPKRLELVRELLPQAASVGLLVNPTSALAGNIAIDLRTAAQKLGFQLHVLEASTERELSAASEKMVLLGAAALVVGIDAFFISRSKQIAELALQHRMPTIFQNREFAQAGGLMSYGGSGTEAYRQVGIYTGKVLSGARPEELPVQQTTKVELIINLETAKRLGLDVPPTLLARADEVIE